MQKAWTFNTIAPVPVEDPGGYPGPEVPRYRVWRSGLFQCFDDIGMCCCVLWCTPCTVGQVASIVRGGAAWVCLLLAIVIIGFNVGGSVLQFIGQEAQRRWESGDENMHTAILWWAGMLSFLASLLTCLAVWNTRAKYRTKNDIRPECGMWSDCLAAWCCSPCAVCQMFAEEDITFAGSRSRPYKLFWDPYANGVGDTGTTAMAV